MPHFPVSRVTVALLFSLTDHVTPVDNELVYHFTKQ